MRVRPRRGRRDRGLAVERRFPSSIAPASAWTASGSRTTTILRRRRSRRLPPPPPSPPPPARLSIPPGVPCRRRPSSLIELENASAALIMFFTFVTLISTFLFTYISASSDVENSRRRSPSESATSHIGAVTPTSEPPNNPTTGADFVAFLCASLYFSCSAIYLDELHPGGLALREVELRAHRRLELRDGAAERLEDLQVAVRLPARTASTRRSTSRPSVRSHIRDRSGTASSVSVIGPPLTSCEGALFGGPLGARRRRGCLLFPLRGRRRV